MSRRIKTGVIGCGTIAQIMHLPYLKELESMYEITALCDISPKLVNKMGDAYNVKERYTDYRELIAESDVDAVLILTPINHSEIAVTAANYGRHVFTEKPMCISLKEADEMIKSADKNNVKLMVGYMRLFDPGYQYVQKIVRKMKKVSLIRQFSSGGSLVNLHDVYTLHRFNDISKKEMLKDRKFIEEKKKELKSIPAKTRDDYFNFLCWFIHDIYVLRGLFGSPKKVLFARRCNPECFVTVMEYSDAMTCIYSNGPWNTKVNDFNIGFSVHGDEKVIDFKFTYDSYLKNDPSSVIIREMEGGVYTEKNARVSFHESFRRELIHFHECIVKEKEPVCSGKEAKKDLELILEIARSVKE